VAVPTATPVTSPPLETVATAGWDVAHATAGFATACPYASVTATVSCTVAPTAMPGVGGVTTTP